MRWWPFTGGERAACAEARDALLLGAADASAEARVARHLARCEACRAVGASLERTRVDRRHDDVPLDDLTRARILDRLAPALDDLASTQGRPSSRMPWGIAAGAAVTAAALAVLVPWRTLLRDGVTPKEAPVVASAPAGSAPAASSAGASSAAASSAASARVPQAPGARVGEVVADDARAIIRRGGAELRELRVGQGERRRAIIGGHTRVLLIGPARLEVVEARPQVVELQLHEGRLVAGHEHGARRILRIRSPQAMTEIVGTRFLIDAQGAGSRVAVLEGRVVVRRDELPAAMVAAGEMWTSAAPARVAPLSREVRRVLASAPRTGAGVGAWPRAALERRPLTPPLSPPGGERGQEGPVVARRAVASAGFPAVSPAAPSSLVPSSAAPSLVAPSSAAPSSAAPSLVAPSSAAPSSADGVAQAGPAPGAPPPATVAPEPASPPPATLGPAPGAPPPATVAPEPALEDARGLYRAAERAMAAGDQRAAERLLVRVAEGEGALANEARFELAQRALRAGQVGPARRWAGAIVGGPLLEPGRLLACEAEARTDVVAARKCYQRFRSEHPGSAHDNEALAALVDLQPPALDCRDDSLLREYLGRQPDGTRAADVRQRLARCTQAPRP